MEKAEEKPKVIAIGIDPGVQTGVAVWDCTNKKFLEIRTMVAIEAMFYLKEYYIDAMPNDHIMFYIEDARKRKFFKGATDKEMRSKSQGAGAVKRDSKYWEEYCKYLDIPFDLSAPRGTKLEISAFKAITKYEGRTNEHNRDAAMKVFGLGYRQVLKNIKIFKQGGVYR